MRSIISYSGSVRRILSKSEKKILRAIVESKGPLNVTELCRKAKVTPKAYYRMLDHPEFRDLLPEALDYLLSQQLLPVVQMVVERALEGSAKHAELVLKISGLIGSEEGTKILQVFGSKDGENQFLSNVEIGQLLKS